MISHAQPKPDFRHPDREHDQERARRREVVGASVLFRGLSDGALDDLVRRMQVVCRAPGACIVAEDDPGESMFLVVSGGARVALFGDNGRELTLCELGPGDFFGELALLDCRPRSARVLALGPTVLCELSRAEFRAHLLAHPQTALNLLGELARRLRRADEMVADLGMRDVESRLVRALERLARAEGGASEGDASEGGLMLKRRPTQQELANRVGSCRETVSRMLSSLVRRGLVVERGRALLLTPALFDRVV